MKIKLNLIVFILLLSMFTPQSYAVEPLTSDLISFASDSGMVLLKKDLNANLLKLLSHFATQKTTFYCGVASVVMILNSVDITPPVDLQHSPYRYFNQDNFFNDKVRKIINPKEVQKKGISLMQLSKIIQGYGLKSNLYYANTLDIKKFRTILRNAISNQQFIIVNFLRSGLKQQGDGHHSPIAAYDEQTDRFLLLDVARYIYPAYWVKTEDLWRAVNTLDEGSYRGFIIITPK